MNYKLFIVVDVLMWLALILSLTAVEILHLDSLVWVVLWISSLLMVACLHVFLLIVFIKNKSRIAQLKDRYIESIKPAQPLRFCPSDEDLVKTHYSQKTIVKRNPKEAVKRTEEKTHDEEIEAENV